MIKHHCESLQEHFVNKEDVKRGISVFARENGIHFLKFSAIDGENEEKFIQLLT